MSEPELDDDDDDDEYISAIAAEQRRELMASKSLDSDLDLAFNLQLQEAINASLSLHDHPPVAVTQPSDGAVPSNFSDLQSDELLKLEQELRDHSVSESEFKRLEHDLHRRIHDHRLALEISNIPYDDWADDYERPYGEGTSGSSGSKGGGDVDEVFRVYFKGLVEKHVNKDGVGFVLGGIGVAICDSGDKLLFELRKPVVGGCTNRRSVEFRALIEGLSAALELQLKRVVFYCDFYPTFQHVTGRWSVKQKKVQALLDQVSCLQEKFTFCLPYLVPRNDIKFAFKLAREAIVSQLSKAAEASGSKSSFETCVICLEDTNIREIFQVDNCMHRYCLSCMKQHVEVKILHGMLPTCPHEGCKTELTIDRCSKFLTPRLIDIMSQRIKEASIPVTEKVYCPYPKCSALMSKREVLEYSKSVFMGAERFGARKCIKCNGRFCINCKVPWHHNLSCFEYKKRNPHPQPEEAKLQNLAAMNLWRQCVKCNHMIELAAGCYHLTCRCGYEFCYTCGAEWRNKKASCACPLWDEENILDDEFDEDEDEYEDEDYEDYETDQEEYW